MTVTAFVDARRVVRPALTHLLLELGGSAPYHARIGEDKVKLLPRTTLRARPDKALGCLIDKNEADVARDSSRINQVRRSCAVGIDRISTRDTLTSRLLTGE